MCLPPLERNPEINPDMYLFRTVPSEHSVIAKERRSGMYHLSAYYLAKTVSELPLVIVQPSFYLLISYWIIGLNGAAAFFGTWFIIITNSLVSQVKIDCHSTSMPSLNTSS
jgi:ABC-type multidrug transport system permease subunit